LALAQRSNKQHALGHDTLLLYMGHVSYRLVTHRPVLFKCGYLDFLEQKT
jgi:hypothetical protein